MSTQVHAFADSLSPSFGSDPQVPPMDVGDDWMDEVERFDAAPQVSAQAEQSQARLSPGEQPKSSVIGKLFKKREAVVGFQGQEPERGKSLLKRGIMVSSLCGIALLVYLQYGGSLHKVPDLLGTRLPATGVPSQGPEFVMPEVDPRLSDGEPLGVGLSALSPDLERPEVEHAGATERPGDMEGAVQLQDVQGAVAPAEAQAAPAASSLQSLPKGAGPVDAPAPSVQGDPQLAERMAKLESMMILMSEQLAEMKTTNAALVARQTAPAPTNNVQPAPQPAIAKPAQDGAAAEQVAPRPAPAPKRVMVKAEPAQAPARSRASVRIAHQKPARSPAVAKADAAEKPKAAGLSGQLVSVDMWNGEPSVVVASGIPGDRRVRVLRPGDVVNGMALKSADPVARTATFVAPGSQGLTLSVSQGG